ncbi:MAG: hypothetical protein KGL11_05240 [Alphaproteobacteria bacterium]|nr:hypothetical protein [Alphaproteobacteria bacterium]
MTSGTVASIMSSRSRERVRSFDFVKLLVWVAAASVPWIGIALIASNLGR